MKKFIIVLIIVSLVVMSSGCTGMFHPISSNENWRNNILGGGNASGMIQNIIINVEMSIKQYINPYIIPKI